MGYYVDKTSSDENYGIYDVFKDYTLKGDYKTLGALGKDKYYFKTDVEDHLLSFDDLEDTVGEYGFYCTTKMIKEGEFELTIGLFTKANPNKFIMRCVMGMISECMRFEAETKFKVKAHVNSNLLLYNVSNIFGLKEMLEALKEKDASMEEDPVEPVKHRFGVLHPVAKR